MEKNKKTDDNKSPLLRLTLYRNLKRRFIDKFFGIIVSFSGIAIILSLSAIVFFLSYEVYPLLKTPKAKLEHSFNIKNSFKEPTEQILSLGIDRYNEIVYAITNKAFIYYYHMKTRQIIEQYQIEQFKDKNIAFIHNITNNKGFILGTENGSVMVIRINFKITFDKNDKRQLTPEVITSDEVKLSYNGIRNADYKYSDKISQYAAITSKNEILVYHSEESENLLGDVIKKESSNNLTEAIKGDTPTTIAIDGSLDNLYIGTEQGYLYHWDISNKENPKLSNAIKTNSYSITSMRFLLGEMSLLVGYSDGSVSLWFRTLTDTSRNETSEIERELTKIHTFRFDNHSILDISESQRNRSFLSVDDKGHITIYYATSKNKILDIEAKVTAAVFSPRGDAIVGFDNHGSVYFWDMEDSHPEVSLSTLFSKIWYEGYSEPKYVWQSTGMEDDFETKISLIPLIFGTIKGTVYALCFSIPLALLSAIYVSQYMDRRFRNTTKAVIEIMAALPSVVIGAIAGLWLAPLIEKNTISIIISPFVISAVILLFAFLWSLIPISSLNKSKHQGSEFLVIMPICLIGLFLCFIINKPLTDLFINGDFVNWLFERFTIQYDQRNSLVVGIAMGFAVIPIIFTISEDALSNVPRHVVYGALALGTTRWQTTIRIVLPIASAGIFSGIIIGFGRAVGETMIVLMATGNTPIMDWNMFNGFRALSANLAVEISEAPQGESLYRVLFLSALLLFIFTFMLNTIAESVRNKLRKKYAKL
ncbi:membrane protein component of ABC phosphate transporter [Candidatus Magnetoovum chiemensis]|nr:membrane protein component of ABC phosphate transporter [Candidatus Magnetoovum chiemensis]